MNYIPIVYKLPGNDPGVMSGSIKFIVIT